MRARVANLCGFIGGLSLILGLLMIFIVPTLLVLRTVLILAGLVSLLLWPLLDRGGFSKFFHQGTTRRTIFSLIFSGIVIGILIGTNILAFRHNISIDLTEGKIHTLSDQSIKVAKSINSPIMIYGFIQEEDRPFFESLTQKYYAKNSLIKAQILNPNVDQGLAKTFDVKSFGTVVVKSGEHFLKIEDRLSESALTNTMLKLRSSGEKLIVFLKGHGERVLEDKEIQGISQLGSALVGQGYQTREINLLEEWALPPKVSVLIVPSPQQPFLPKEGELLSRYLNEGGSIVLLLDPNANHQLDSFLSAWGIVVGPGVIIDPDASSISGGADIPIVGRYGEHDITVDLRNYMIRTVYPQVTAVGIRKPPVGTKVTPLAFSSPRSWLESKMEKEVSFNPPSDLKGPLTIGVIAEKTMGDKQARLIVFGDSDFASNQLLQVGGNKSLMVNIVRYLTDDRDLISILPNTPKFHEVLLTKSQLSWIQLFALIVCPLFILLAGGIIWWRRNRFTPVMPSAKRVGHPHG